MPDFANARHRMVDNQIRTADVTHRPLLAAIDIVPRELFLPEAAKPFAYSDRVLAVAQIEATGEPRYALEPALLARMIQAVEPVHSMRALHVACGTGYGSALLAKLGAEVVGLDEDPKIAVSAKSALELAGAAGVTVLAGPLSAGAPQQGPFDVILIEGAYQREPESLAAQLAEGGRLIGIKGLGRSAQVMLQIKIAGKITGRAVFDASAPLLSAFAKAPEFSF